LLLREFKQHLLFAKKNN